MTDILRQQGADPMHHATEQSMTGTYGHLTITYRRLSYTWTVAVYSGPTRIQELCATYSAALPAYREAQRIARAARHGTHVVDIIAAKPSEQVLHALREIVGSAGTPAPEFAAAR